MEREVAFHSQIELPSHPIKKLPVYGNNPYYIKIVDLMGILLLHCQNSCIITPGSEGEIMIQVEKAQEVMYKFEMEDFTITHIINAIQNHLGVLPSITMQ